MELHPESTTINSPRLQFVAIPRRLNGVVFMVSLPSGLIFSLQTLRQAHELPPGASRPDLTMPEMNNVDLKQHQLLRWIIGPNPDLTKMMAHQR